MSSHINCTQTHKFGCWYCCDQWNLFHRWRQLKRTCCRLHPVLVWQTRSWDMPLRCQFHHQGTKCLQTHKSANRALPAASLPCASHFMTSSMSLFRVYAPCLQVDPAEKDRFYTNLWSLLTNIPANDKIVILGDFNSRVGWDAVAWKGILGQNGIGNCNGSGFLLPEFCAKQQLSIMNTLFQHNKQLGKLPGCILSPNIGTC